MARLPQLVDALTAVDGRPLATLDYIARLIREAGLITTTSRGAGAATMTARDAANLLIGANAVPDPKLAPVAVNEFRLLRQTPHGLHERGAVYEVLAKCERFGDAVEALIEGAPKLDATFRSWTARNYGRASLDLHQLVGPRLEVEFVGVSAAIRVLFTSNGSARAAHEWAFLPDAELLARGGYTLPAGGPDRRVSVAIGLPTLLALHHAVFKAPK